MGSAEVMKRLGGFAEAGEAKTNYTQVIMFL